MNCIFVAVFNQRQYVDMFFLLLESICKYGNLGESTNVLIYTSTPFMNIIKKNRFFNNKKIIFEINNTYDNIDKACKARLDLFKLSSVKKYNKILYLDTDVLIKGDINKVFEVCKEDILYVLEEGHINGNTDAWGKPLFGNEINNYKDKSAFTSGMLLFNNCDKIKGLFQKINEDIKKRPRNFGCHDQPYIIYNAFKYNLFNNKVLKSLAVNNDKNIHSDKIIHHFPGGPGVFKHKIPAMAEFLNSMNNFSIKNKSVDIILKITPVLFQTSKTKVEDYVLEMIKRKLGNKWKYEFYNDENIIQFFIDNPIEELPNIIDKFNSFKKGQHKADLFRYYYLYVRGGVFVDSDAMIYVNIEDIVKDYDFISVNSSCHPGTIFQGILGASPKNQMIKRALYEAYNTHPNILDTNYHYFCKQLYDIIKSNNHGYKIKLYEEKRTKGGYDDILNGHTILFKHFWRNKTIPLNNTPYTEEFVKIYNTNYWINGSGSGSFIENTKEYNNYIVDFIKKNNIKSITDIGCGDWQSSYLIYNQFDNIDYLGLDCVNSVIEKNKENHPKYKFFRLDILCNIDLIRDSEVYIIKDVLQHWKLKDIYCFLDQLVTKQFKYIIITNNGNQGCHDNELNAYIGKGRGLHSSFLPLQKYNAEPLLDFFGGENKHMCVIKKDNCLTKNTNWNNYNKNEINSFDYRILNTYKIPNTLLRVGPKCDGGYVIADGLDYDLFVSCGIANDVRFEEGFLDIHKIKCIAFDGTIKSFPSKKNNMEWIPKNIGFFNTEKTTNLKEYIKNSNKIFLKMDIEGSEFNWLDSMTLQELDNFSQIVLEVHWPFDIYRMNMLKKLNETHYIIHIHGNNYCNRDIPKHLPSGRTYDGMVTINNCILPQIKLPEVFEVTYINKKLCNKSFVEMKEIKNPTILDYPNNPNAKDVCFSIPVITNRSYEGLKNKTYTWGSSYIKFLDNFKMEAFGAGHYEIIDNQNIIAKFGGKIHKIKFNEDYTSFVSTRVSDSQIVNGKLKI